MGCDFCKGGKSFIEGLITSQWPIFTCFVHWIVTWNSTLDNCCNDGNGKCFRLVASIHPYVKLLIIPFFLQDMMLDLVRYHKPLPLKYDMAAKQQGLSTSEFERRFDMLVDACDRDSSLLTVVEKLKSAFVNKQFVN